MRSPFPGIDPYLESPGYWPAFHQRFITYCCDSLNDLLPEDYEARLGEQLRLVELREPVARTVLPDVAVLQRGPVAGPTARSEGGLLTLEPVTLDLPLLEVEEVRDLWIEIRHRPQRNLVTAIEVLSPTNKTGAGRHDYLIKRFELTRQQVHFVELDLLLRGQRLPMEQALPPGDFYAFLRRAENRKQSQVYAWTIRQPLPVIPIPLLAPDPDIPLDLPGLFTMAYERGRYARSLDYSATLEVPLSPPDLAWAGELARRVRR
jgi:uncharacterized protein DUF4058